MQSKLINLPEIINNDVSCENKDHRHRKPYSSNFFAIINSTQDGIYNSIADCCCRFPWLQADRMVKGQRNGRTDLILQDPSNYHRGYKKV